MAQGEDFTRFTEPKHWEILWEKGLAPGDYFDAEAPCPAFVNSLSEPWVPANGRALVPGCGRGYDLVALLSTGKFAYVTGLDVSTTAVNSALSYLKTVKPSLDESKYSVKSEDFFELDPNQGKYSLVYDYTFLCAIQPHMRHKWAKKMSSLVEKGGMVITMMFPLGSELGEDGPPFTLTVDLYRELLESNGFRAVDGPRIVRNDQAHERRGDGKSGFARWERLDS